MIIGISQDLIFGIRISIIGIGVVFSALILIQCLLNIVRIVDKISLSKIKDKETTQEKNVEEQISPELIAVISAAVTVAISKKVKIKKIRYRKAPPEYTWKKQGIATIMASHIRRKY